MLDHLDLFSGIGGFSLGLEQSGYFNTPVAYCEIDKYCRRVLYEHYPTTPFYVDVKHVNGEDYRGIDLITGGFPCQDLSIAGKRQGLEGDRSGLWFEFSRIIESARPKWVVIENVPGLLSSRSGRDFGLILRQMDEFGYAVGWRVFDAQNFGVPQRRRRVFIVCSLGNASALEVLFDTSGNKGYTEESNGEGGETTTTSGGDTYSFDSRNNSVSYGVTQTLQSKSTGGWSLNYMPVVGTYWDGTDKIDTLTASTLSKQHMMPDKQHFSVVNINNRLRRLTPLEAERLMGFPGGWTDVGNSETQRYKQLGNAVVPAIVKQIAERLAKVEHASRR